MKFLWTTIMVDNMEESVHFYRDLLGLPIQRRHPGGPGMELCFLGEGDTKVELIYDANRKAENQFQGISMGFEVASLEDQIRFLADHGVAVESGPFSPSPSISYFFVKDPNGLKIQFAEQK